MVNKIYCLILCSIAIYTAYAGNGANGQILLYPNQGYTDSYAVSTYANNQVDTVIWVREPGVSSITFSIFTYDSVQFGANSGWIYRVNNERYYHINSDTLGISYVSSTNDDTGNPFTQGYLFMNTVSLTPLSDKIVFIIRYHSSGNGVTGNKVIYKVNKLYSK